MALASENPNRAKLNKVALLLTNNLSLFILGAGVLGYVAEPVSRPLAPITPFLLALMIAGSGLTISLKDVGNLKGTVFLTGLTLILQLTLLPLFGFGLYQLLPDTLVGAGILAIGVAPSEITSALMTQVAKGNLGLSLRLMVASIFISIFLTPFWLGLFVGKSLPLDIIGISVELMLVIGLPFLVASGLRTRFTGLAVYKDEFGSLSALAVVILIFVVGGSLNGIQLSWGTAWLIIICLIFNLTGYLLGWIIGMVGKQPFSIIKALIFTSGMREFGIASTVAINFLPPGAAVAPAIYGLIMMLSASVVGSRLASSPQ